MEPVEDDTKKPLLSSRIYDWLRHLQIVLPALGALYFAIATTWGLPSGAEVVATCATLVAFLGALLKFSSVSYDKSTTKFAGDVVISTTPAGTKLYTLELNGDPSEIDAKDSVTFKVKPNSNINPNP